MSGYPRDREDELTGAMAEGAVLAKPFTPRELCDAVRRSLDRPARTGAIVRGRVGSGSREPSTDPMDRPQRASARTAVI